MERSTSLRRKLTFAALFGSVLFIIGFTVFSFSRSYFLLNEIDSLENYSLNNITNRAEKYALREEERRLTVQNEAISNLLSTEFRQISEDVSMLRDTFVSFLEHPEKIQPRTLPNALYEDVKSETPYVHYSQRLLKNGLTQQLEKEIKAGSNIADLIPFFTDYYKCLFFGSESGYIIAEYVMNHATDLVPVSKEPFRHTYDPVSRIWYQKGKDYEDTGFTDVYIAQTGDMTVSCISPYFVNGRFHGVMGVDCSPKWVSDLVKSIAVDEGDLYFILSNKGEVLFVNFDSDIIKVTLGVDIRNSDEKSLAKIAEKMVEHKKGFDSVTISEKDYFVAYSPIKNVNWSFASLIPVEQVYAPSIEIKSHLLNIKDTYYSNLKNSIILVVFSTSVVVLLLLFFIFRRIIRLSDFIVNPIIRLTRDVNEFAEGNLDKRLQLDSLDEISNIAESFNSLAQKLQDNINDLSVISEQKKRLDAEVNVVNEILMNYLPDNFSILNKYGFDLFAKEYPAKSSGGDFYDFYLLDNQHVVVSIGDVSGRGVPSALFMMTSKSVIKSFCRMNSDLSLGDILYKANNCLHEHNTEQMYVALFICIIDLYTGRMEYVNSGHYAPYIYRAESGSGNFLINERIDSIMAINANVSFHSNNTVLNPGDMLYMYTDGIISENSLQGEKFDEKKLTEAVLNAKENNMTSKEIVEFSYKSAVDFIGRDVFSDDVTLLCLRRKQKCENK